jgi:hypothetical protein
MPGFDAQANANMISALALLRTRAILTAAGAYDVAPLVVPCIGFREAMLFIDYDENAGGIAGAMDFYIEYSPFSLGTAVTDWFMMSVLDIGAVAAGAVTTNLIQSALVRFTPVGAATETFVYGPLHLGGGIERIRFNSREIGQVGFPGTVGAYALFSV